MKAMLKLSRLLKLALLFTLNACLLGAAGQAMAQERDLSGARLYQDVRTYSDFGVHRYGSVGASNALAWIATELGAAGLTVDQQPLRMGRQLVLEKAQVTLGGKTLEAFAHWWPPEHQGEFALEAALKPDEESAGAIAWLRLPYERGAYLNAQHRQKIMEVAAHKPLAILLTIDNPAGSIFTYNVNQEDAAWPVPVIVVPARLAAELESARKQGAKVRITLQSRYENEVASYNVIGRLDNGAAQTVVVSTPGVMPYSGWPGVLEPHWRKFSISPMVTALKPVRCSRA